MIETLTHPMLLPIAVPLLAGLVCLLLPGTLRAVRPLLAVLASASVLYLSWPLYRMVSGGEGGAVVETLGPLVLLVDPLSAFVVMAIAFFALLIAIYSIGYMAGQARSREYFTYFLWTLGSSCAVVLANDLILLLVCWGFLGLLLYLMIGVAGAKAAEAARTSLMTVGGSDALMLFGIVILWTLNESARMDMRPLPLDSLASYTAFLTLMAGAFAKAGIFPFHSWVPDCGEKADAPVAAYLPASLDKLLGIYLLTRCMTALFVPTSAVYFLLMAIGAITIVTMSLAALAQRDLKRLLSYTAVAQVGYILMGIGTATPLGLAGGLFHMLNHAVYKAALFLCSGVVEKEAGSTDLDKLGGLARLIPVTFVTCTIAALAGAGVPPLNGFASKWMVYQGILSGAESGGLAWVIWLTVAMLGSALTLAAFVKALHATFLCKASPEVNERVHRQGICERSRTMLLPLVVLSGLCVIFGVFAYQLPLRWLILPVTGPEAIEAMSGVWWAGLATTLILGAILLGLAGYWLTMRAGRLRRVSTYIGGEKLQDVHVSGEPAGERRHVEVTGVEFFDTIEQLPALARIYSLARARIFDIYHLLQTGVGYLVQMLRSFHTGILPAYLRWFVAGMLVVVWVVTRSGS